MFPASKLIVAACIAAASSLAHAEGQRLWTATPNGVLESMRGGYGPSPGLWVSFAIERVIRIDGQTAMHSSLVIPDLGNLNATQMETLAQQLGAIGVVQTGDGNTLAGTQVRMSPGIVIQNTQNNRLLQSTTEISVVTNSMRLLQGLNFGQSLNDALQGSLPR